MSTRRFFDDLRLAASHTRLMHSFATCDRVAKSNVFIDALISRQPMYRTSNVTPSFMMTWSGCSQSGVGLLLKPLSKPEASPLRGIAVALLGLGLLDEDDDDDVSANLTTRCFSLRLRSATAAARNVSLRLLQLPALLLLVLLPILPLVFRQDPR